jgi:uncharacterized surface protein with fasciclin (FAS1) repeats
MLLCVLSSSRNIMSNTIHNIVDTAVAAGTFTTLCAALTAADLIPTLQGPGPFTVFAPTDDAFKKLPAGTVESLLKDKAKLAAILTYHVVAKDITPGDVKTVQGTMITLATAGGATVNGAHVTTADIDCTNGVIHVIDTVLLPK